MRMRLRFNWGGEVGYAMMLTNAGTSVQAGTMYSCGRLRSDIAVLSLNRGKNQRLYDSVQ